jgi:hypothetical protein
MRELGIYDGHGWISEDFDEFIPPEFEPYLFADERE